MNANGRVDIIQPDINKQFSLYDKIPVGGATPYLNALQGQQEETLLSSLYFSKENVQIVHNAIRAGVHKKSNGRYIIGKQNVDTLKIIMRSVFLQNAVNQKNNIQKKKLLLLDVQLKLTQINIQI